jgi:hypothetical protein
MPERKRKLAPGEPTWTLKEETSGLDPLGMQTACVALYQQMLPGISNVTLRMRYYGFYAWLANTYASEVGDPSIERWCIYVRRAEALYALAANLDSGERGVAGAIWAGRKMAASLGGRIAFRENTDREEGRPQYLKQKFGAFGAAYGSQLFAMGILTSAEAHSIPIPTPELGLGLAEIFQRAVGPAGPAFLKAATAGAVSKSSLEEFGTMLPSKISKTGRERKAYAELLFTRPTKGTELGAARRESLRLILKIGSQSAQRINAADVRWSLYASRYPNGKKIPSLPSDEQHSKFAWTTYHANDLLHVCYETILKFTLDLLGSYPGEVPYEQFVNQVAERIHRALKEEGKANSWQGFVDAKVLASDPWSESDRNAEFTLQKEIFEGSGKTQICSNQTVANSIGLLAALYKRFASQLAKIREAFPLLHASQHSQSIVTEIEYLLVRKDKPLGELLRSIVKERVVERHLYVAIQKLRSQGDYTFLLETEGGLVRLREKYGPTFTNPRLNSSITFLTDVGLLGDGGLTEAGRLQLEAA